MRARLEVLIEQRGEDMMTKDSEFPTSRSLRLEKGAKQVSDDFF